MPARMPDRNSTVLVLKDARGVETPAHAASVRDGGWINRDVRRLQEREEGSEKREKSDIEASTVDENSALVRSSIAVSPLQPLQLLLPYQDNLVPYGFLSVGGPVLMLPYNSLPFQKLASHDPYSPVLSPRQSIWMPNARFPEPSKVESSILGLELLGWISNTPNCIQFRLAIIKWIQDRFLNPHLATSDDTIGAMMTLTMWESYRSLLRPTDLVTHMNGLELMVKLRGGLDAIPPAQAAKIALFDHIIAAMTLQQPCFPLRSRVNFAPSSQPRFYDSPLYGSLRFSSFIDHTCANVQICALLETLRDITDAALSNAPFRHLRAHIRLSVPTDPLHKVLHAAAQIYIEALCSPGFFSSPLPLPWLEILTTNLDLTTGAQFWREKPGVRLWVLLVGASSAIERAEREYFMMYLARVNMFEESWENEKIFRKWCALFFNKGAISNIGSLKMS